VLTLSEAGVGRGTARAVAHVGTELLLDGALSRDDTRAVRAYRAALEIGAHERLVDHLDLAGSANAQAMHDGLIRLAGAPIPEGYREAAFVFARLRSILARRPRLAMQDGDLARVQQYLEEIQPRVTQLAPELLEQVRVGLAREPAQVMA
jgi:acyl carrier protein phosphodiesterase